MKTLLYLSVIFLVGCDTLYGVDMPVYPPYTGSWNCVKDQLNEAGYETAISEPNQLSIKKDGIYILSVFPSQNKRMFMYSHQFYSLPTCENTMTSFNAAKKLLDIMYDSCGYEYNSYKVAMECSSNQQLKQAEKTPDLGQPKADP